MTPLETDSGLQEATSMEGARHSADNSIHDAPSEFAWSIAKVTELLRWGALVVLSFA